MAVAMRAHVSPVVAKGFPAAVMSDPNALDYVWGDAIGGVAMPLLDNVSSLTRPTCVVAAAHTHPATPRCQFA